MNHLYPQRARRQRLVDTVLAYGAALVFLPFTLWQDREYRKAARR